MKFNPKTGKLISFRKTWDRSRKNSENQLNYACPGEKGSIGVTSSLGGGTHFTIKIPVAISVTEGLVFSINSQQYIIPLVNIRETLRPRKDDYFTVEGRGEMIRLRENLLPLIRLDGLFRMNDNTSVNPWEAMVAVVENEGDFRCILVDEIIGKQELVIQNLGGQGWINSECILGGSIMADGKVSLVLDIRGIFHQTARMYQ